MTGFPFNNRRHSFSFPLQNRINWFGSTDMYTDRTFSFSVCPWCRDKNRHIISHWPPLQFFLHIKELQFTGWWRPAKIYRLSFSEVTLFHFILSLHQHVNPCCLKQPATTPSHSPSSFHKIPLLPLHLDKFFFLPNLGCRPRASRPLITEVYEDLKRLWVYAWISVESRPCSIHFSVH